MQHSKVLEANWQEGCRHSFHAGLQFNCQFPEVFPFFYCSLRVVVVVTALPTFVLGSSAPICSAPAGQAGCRALPEASRAARPQACWLHCRGFCALRAWLLKLCSGALSAVITLHICGSAQWNRWQLIFLKEHAQLDRIGDFTALLLSQLSGTSQHIATH